MKIQRLAIIALAGLACVCKAQAQQPMDVSVVPGACQPQSARTQDGQKTSFACDNAILAFFDNENSHVMVQFAKKGDDSAPLLGFGGTMEEDGLTLDVDRIYLEAGKPQLVQGASCKFSFDPPASADAQPNMTAIACSGQVAGATVEVGFKPGP